MKGFLLFFCGVVVGGLLTLFVLFLIGSSRSYQETQAQREALQNKIQANFEALYAEPEIQYIDVKGRNGNVVLHTGMSKDSVQMLVGKPDKVDLRTIMNSTHEDWAYHLTGHNPYLSDLEIAFEDGKLTGVQQR